MRQEELETVLEMLCEGFQLPLKATHEAFLANPYFSLENTRVWRVNGQVVSSLMVVDTVCRLGKGTARLAGIAGVVTKLQERQRGYAGQLLTETIPALEEQGFALTALFPTSYSYYQKFGWETCGLAYRLFISPDHLLTFSEARHVHNASPDEIPELQHLYDTHNATRTLTCLRDAKRWQHLLNVTKQRVVYAPHRGQVEGYLLYEHRAFPQVGQEDMAPGVTLPPNLHILEMVVATPAAQRGLLGYLAKQSNMGSIEYTASWHDIQESGFLEPLATATGGDVLASIEVVPAVMVRILNFKRCIQALCPNWVGFDGTLGLGMYDTQRGHASYLVVQGTGQGEPQVIGVSGIYELQEGMKGTVQAWNQVITGHHSAEEALARGLLSPIPHATPHTTEMASHLFPSRHPFLPLPDHF